MELAAIIGAVEGLKVAGEFITAGWGTRVDAAAQPKIQEALDKVGRAQAVIYEMRDELFRLQAENHELRMKQAAIDSWAQTAAKFEIVNTLADGLAYKSIAGIEYYACPSCFNNKEICPLQPQANTRVSGRYRCGKCGGEVPINPRADNPTHTAAHD